MFARFPSVRDSDRLPDTHDGGLLDLTLLAIPRFRNGFPRPRSTCNCTTRSVSPDHSLHISRCWSTRTGASSVSEPATSALKITS